MKLSKEADTDRIIQHFMDTYGYFIGAAAMIGGFVLITYLIMK